jgi:hypothetical protein
VLDFEQTENHAVEVVEKGCHVEAKLDEAFALVQRQRPKDFRGVKCVPVLKKSEQKQGIVKCISTE